MNADFSILICENLRVSAFKEKQNPSRRSFREGARSDIIAGVPAAVKDGFTSPSDGIVGTLAFICLVFGHLQNYPIVPFLEDVVREL